MCIAGHDQSAGNERPPASPEMTYEAIPMTWKYWLSNWWMCLIRRRHAWV